MTTHLRTPPFGTDINTRESISARYHSSTVFHHHSHARIDHVRQLLKHLPLVRLRLLVHVRPRGEKLGSDEHLPSNAVLFVLVLSIVVFVRHHVVPIHGARVVLDCSDPARLSIRLGETQARHSRPVRRFIARSSLVLLKRVGNDRTS